MTRINQIISIIAMITMAATGCSKVIGLDDFERLSKSESDQDTSWKPSHDTDANADYWDDGYCPLITQGGEVLGIKVSDDCKGIDGIGCCDGHGSVIYCDKFNLYCIPCAFTSDETCSWDASENYYTCTTQSFPASDPSNESPLTCTAVPENIINSGDSEEDTTNDTTDNTPGGSSLVRICNEFDDVLTGSTTYVQLTVNDSLVLTANPGECSSCETFAPSSSVEMAIEVFTSIGNISTGNSVNETLDVLANQDIVVWSDGVTPTFSSAVISENIDCEDANASTY